MRTFAAIDVGSFELEMKIFELSGKLGMRQIEDVRHRLDLGTDTYTTGKISYDKVDELCAILKEFKTIMKTYRVDEYRAYGTSAVREAMNTRILLDQVEQRTGIHIEMLSNSEQRFMDYKSIASRTDEFNRLMAKNTAILDVGGGSLQVSLFEKGTLQTTQNLKLGVLRLQERLRSLDATASRMEGLIEEMVAAQVSVFKKLYLKDNRIENLILVDDYLSDIFRRSGQYGEMAGYMHVETYMGLMDSIHTMSAGQLAATAEMSREKAQLLYISAILVRSFARVMNTELIWAPGVTLCDGIAYEYAEENKIFHVQHDFERDILTSAEHISKRFMGSRKRSDTLEKIALTIFDSMKKIHGLGKRERLLLQLATRLHDCGKYVSMVNLGECSYYIIMNSEIIGLSDMEREIVANVVKYNHMEFDYFEVLARSSTINEQSYLLIAKLTAILKVSNGLDRSHKQKFKDIKTALKDGELTIRIDTDDDITLEKGLFTARADFFEEVFAVKPVIRQKRRL